MDSSAVTPDSARQKPELPPEPPLSFLQQLQMAALGLLILCLVIYLLKEFAVVLQQLLTAVFLAYLLLPIRQWLGRWHLSAFVSYTVIIVGVLLSAWILAVLIQNSVQDFTRQRVRYEQNLRRLSAEVGDYVPGLRAEHIQYLIDRELPDFNASVEVVGKALQTMSGTLMQVVIVLVYLAFLVAEQGSMSRRIYKAFAPGRAEYILTVIRRINASISHYIAVKTFVSLLTGVGTTLVLAIFNVDYAVLWGIIAFLLNYIPYVGSVIAVMLPSLLCLVQFETPWIALTVLFLLNAIHTVIGYYLEPVMAGQRLDLSPLIIIASLAFWGSLWGIVGMILAVPLVASIKIVLENIPTTRPLALMLSHVGPVRVAPKQPVAAPPPADPQPAKGKP